MVLPLVTGVMLPLVTGCDGYELGKCGLVIVEPVEPVEPVERPEGISTTSKKRRRRSPGRSLPRSQHEPTTVTNSSQFSLCISIHLFASLVSGIPRQRTSMDMDNFRVLT